MELFTFSDLTYIPSEFLVFWGCSCEILRFSFILFPPFWNRELKNTILNKEISSSLQGNFELSFWYTDNSISLKAEIINTGKGKTFCAQWSMWLGHKWYFMLYSMRYILRITKWNKKDNLVKDNAYFFFNSCKHFG